MKKISTGLLLASSLLFIISSTAMAEPTAAELRGICEAERQKLLAPLRKEAIDECVNKKRNTQEYCERFYRDFGEGGGTQQGGYRQRMFHDIPECIVANEAEKREKGASNRDTEPGKNRDSTTIDNTRGTEPGKNRDTDEPGKQR